MSSGTMDKVSGKIKEVVGKVTGDRKTEAEGKADQVKGTVKNTADSVGDAAKGVQDSLKKG